MADFLTEALKAGASKRDIADFLSEKRGVPASVAREQGATDDQIIAYLLEADAGTAFGAQFMQGLKSSAQGIGQMLGMADTEDIRAQREAADIMSTFNPKIGFAGSLVGNILDPVALPTAIVAPLRGATLAGTLAKKGAAQGAFSGFVEPVTREEANTGVMSLDRVLNTIIGAPIGAAIGGGAGALIQRFGRKAETPETTPEATPDVSPAVRADELQVNAQKALDDLAQLERSMATPEPTRAFETPITGEGVASRIIDEPQRQAITTRIGQLQSEVDELRWRQTESAVTSNTIAEPQTAALLRGETPAPVNLADNLPSTSRGLFTPTRAEPSTQVPALLQRPAQAVPEAPRGIATPQQPALFQGGLDNAIQTRQDEIARLRNMLTEQDRLIADVNKPAMVQVETKVAEPMQAQRLAPEQEQAVLSKYGFTNRQEAEAALTRPETTGEAPIQEVIERIDFAEGRSALNLGFGKDSIGAARAPKELVYAGDIPFNTNAQKVLEGYKYRKSTVAPVRDAEDTEIARQVVAAAGAAGKRLRGLDKGPASFENFPARAAAAEQKMTKEAADLVDWALQNKSNEWSADQVAALAPQFYKSLDFLRNTFAEYNALRRAGKMTDELETEIMMKSQMHLGMVTIFQGQRSKASAKMNALKYAKDAVMSGKRVDGYATPNAGCV